MEMKDFLKKYVFEFDRLTSDLPKLSGGISRSEAFAFCALCRLYGIDLVIDSGTGRGISSEYFARVLDFVITIDNHIHYDDSLETSYSRLKHYDNILFIVGDSFRVIPFLLQTMKYERCAIFLDGPKGQNAFRLANELDIIFAGFHDATPNTPDGTFFEEQGLFLHTLDEWFLDEYGFLNRGKDRIKTQGYLNGAGTAFWYRHG